MKKEKLLRITTSILTCIFLLVPSTNVFAEAVNNEKTEGTFVYEDVSISSTDIPRSSSVDLSYGTTLAFNVTKLSYGNLFTNDCFTGVTSIKVNVSSISVDKNNSSSPTRSLKVTLYKRRYNKIESKTIDTNGGDLYFDGLKKGSNYYLEFSKTNDGQIFSFDGSISSND